MSALESIIAWWEKRVATKLTISDKGTAIEPGQTYYQKLVEARIGGRTEKYETIMLTEKEHFIQRLQGEE